MPLSRRTNLILAAIVLGPFAVLILAAHFLSPALRDNKLRSELARVGESFERLDVDDVRVYYDASIDPPVAGDAGRALGAFCETLVEQWGDLFSLRRVEAPIILEIFASNAQLESFHKRRFREEFHNLGGFYDTRSRLIAVPIGPFGAPDVSTILHEGTHLVFDLSTAKGIGRYPIWVNEGLATYFEVTPLGGNRRNPGVREDGARLASGDGLGSGGVQLAFFDLTFDALASGRLGGLDALVKAGPTEFSGPDNAIYYAAAHTFVAYILLGDDGAYRRAFGRFFDDLRGGGKPDPGLIYYRLGSSPESVEEGWRRFLRNVREGRF